MSEAPERIWVEGSLEWDSGIWARNIKYDDDVEYVRADRIEELERKLAKAVEALEFLSNYKNLDSADGYYDAGATILNYHVRTTHGDFDDIARTTLAELKGETDE